MAFLFLFSLDLLSLSLVNMVIGGSDAQLLYLARSILKCLSNCTGCLLNMKNLQPQKETFNFNLDCFETVVLRQALLGQVFQGHSKILIPEPVFCS